MDKILKQLQELKASNKQLRELKMAEAAHHKEYFRNCQKVISMLRDKRKDFVLESLSQIDASVCAISSDVQAFKNIRNRLFAQITEEIQKDQAEQAAQGNHSRTSSIASQAKTLNNNRLYLYLFHLFESVVSNVAQLVNKTMHSTISQCGENINIPLDEFPKVKQRNTITDTINTIASGSELITAGENKQGFFAENVKLIAKSSKSIEKAIDQITNELIAVNANGHESRLMHEKVQKFIAQLPPVNADNSFEVRWSLSELEDIVYDFINAHELPKEFKVGIPEVDVKTKGVRFSKETKQDVQKEDLMKVAKAEKDDNLQMMVRDYILHDRGNSLFLGDSFDNLPSPVNEDPTIKKLFKFNEDEPMDKKRGNQSKNQAIRIEGKKDKNEEKKASPDKIPQKEFKVDLAEIDKIVFVETAKEKAYGDPSNKLPTLTAQRQVVSNQGGLPAQTSQSQDKKTGSKHGSLKPSKDSIKPYEEEESYENPVNISKAPGCQEDYVDIQSEYVLDPNKVNLSIGMVNQSMINQSQDGEAIVQISNLVVDENALESYQIIQNVHSKNQSIIKCNVQDDEDSQNNTIKLLKEDIVVGGQMGPGVKITKSSKGIRIGQSSQINAQQAKNVASHEPKLSDPKAKYGSIESSGSGKHKLNVEKSPRVVGGFNPNQQSTETERPSQIEMMNSSCKDTIRMNERREFSFVEQMSQEKAPQKPNEYFLVQNIGRTGEGGILYSVNDTVSRLQGFNSSQNSKQDGIIYGPDGNSFNPFISDSYLFQNSTNPNNETNNFGVNHSSEMAYNGLAFVSNYHTVQGSKPTSGVATNSVFSTDIKVQPFINNRNSVGSVQDSLKKAPMVFPSSDANLTLSSGKHQTPNPSKSQTTLSKSGSKKKFMTQSGKSDTRNSRNTGLGGKKNSVQPHRQSQVTTQPKNGQGGISSMNLQQLSKSVSQRNIEAPSSILPSNNLQTPVVHASLVGRDQQHTFDMRTSSVDNNRNITKVGQQNNRSQSSTVGVGNQQNQNQSSAQRQKQNQIQSTDYPGMIKGQNIQSQQFDPQKYSNMEALKAVLNQRSAQVTNSTNNPQRNSSNGLQSKSFQEGGFPNNSKSNSFTSGQKGARGLTAVQSQPAIGLVQNVNISQNGLQQAQTLKDTEKAYDFYARNQSVGSVSNQTSNNTVGSSGMNNSAKGKRKNTASKKAGALNQSTNSLNQNQAQQSSFTSNKNGEKVQASNVSNQASLPKISKT